MKLKKQTKKNLMFGIGAVLTCLNIVVISILKWDSIVAFFGINEQKFFSVCKACLSLEALTLTTGVLLLLQYRSAIFRKFLSLRLTYRIVIGFFMGIVVGLMLRFNPDWFAAIGLHAQSFKILGKIFVDLIKMIITPLIFTSITCSIIGVSDGKKTGSIAAKSVAVFIIMTFISVSIGMLSTHIIKPGKMIANPSAIIESNQGDTAKIAGAGTKMATLGDFILDIIPDNIFKSFYNSNFLQVIFFAVIFGTAIRMSGNDKNVVTKGILALNDIMFKITDLVMQIAPFGIFGFVTWLVGGQDIALIKSLGVIVMIVYTGTLFVVYVLYALFIRFVLKLNPLQFYKKMAPIQFTGFLLASSSAVLPLSLKAAQEKLGVSKEKAMFVIPLGATVNMNGTALNLGVSVIFISQLFSPIPLDLSQMFYILILCTLGAVGTAPVPGASIFLLSGILGVLHLPIEAIGIILAVDRILDMMRTFGNITGDVLSAVIIDRMDKTLDKEVWDAKPATLLEKK